jgi:hypothetical protein
MKQSDELNWFWRYDAQTGLPAKLWERLGISFVKFGRVFAGYVWLHHRATKADA